jgi:hypothetical protein
MPEYLGLIYIYIYINITILVNDRNSPNLTSGELRAGGAQMAGSTVTQEIIPGCHEVPPGVSETWLQQI